MCIRDRLEALESGKWANGLKRVSLEEWKQKMLELGLNRVASGLDANKKKVEEFAAQLLPHIEAGQKIIEKCRMLLLRIALTV